MVVEAGVSERFECVHTLSLKGPELILDMHMHLIVLMFVQTIVARIKVYTS